MDERNEEAITETVMENNQTTQLPPDPLYRLAIGDFNDTFITTTMQDTITNGGGITSTIGTFVPRDNGMVDWFPEPIHVVSNLDLTQRDLSELRDRINHVMDGILSLRDIVKEAIGSGKKYTDEEIDLRFDRLFE